MNETKRLACGTLREHLRWRVELYDDFFLPNNDVFVNNIAVHDPRIILHFGDVVNVNGKDCAI